MSWEGWNVGSVTVRRVRIDEQGVVSVQSRRHGGDLGGTIRSMLTEKAGETGEPESAVATGLLFAPDIHYRELLQLGHGQVSVNSWTEASCTAGRYLLSLGEGEFDGFVNIGAFNCTPACSATAVTHHAAVASSVPYAVIESDGASITASQLRQLEAVAAQCWERR